MTNRSHIIVEGAGIAGLCAACELALRGEHVTIVEHNRHAGADVHIVRDRRFSFDTGPVVLTNPSVLESLFTRAGRDAADYYRLFELDPQPRFWFEDGVAINLNRRPEVFARMLDQQLPLVRPGSDWMNFISLFEQKSRSAIRDWIGVIADPRWETAVHNAVNEKHLRQVCKYAAGYLSDGTLNMTDRVEHGMWYPMGGMREIVKSLERLAAELGVRFRYGTPFDSLQIGSEKVIRSSQTLCPSAHDRLVFFFALKKRYEHLTFLNVFLGSDSKQEFEALYKNGTIAPHPTLEVVSPCIIDPAHAPMGGDAMRVTVQVPRLRAQDTWRGLGGLLEQYHDVIHKRLNQFGMEELKDRIVAEYAMTPPELAKLCISSGDCRDISRAATAGINAANTLFSDPNTLKTARA